MNLIVFDLEWNMGNAPKTFNYHGAELTLRGEIIQIGAVRVDENGDVLDTFEMTLRPPHFPQAALAHCGGDWPEPGRSGSRGAHC